MKNKIIGEIIKVTSDKVNLKITDESIFFKNNNDLGNLSFISVGSYIGTYIHTGEIIILRIEEILKIDDLIAIASYVGTMDSLSNRYTNGVTVYPIIGEKVFLMDQNESQNIFKMKSNDYIGSYFYDENVKIAYDADVIFGKHLGVFGNTGSGKTCTVVSLIQNYIRNNSNKDIKFIILDVNGEYKEAFTEEEYEYYDYSQIHINHCILDNVEYGKLFRAAEGIQYPALKDVIKGLGDNWKLSDLIIGLEKWIIDNTPLKDTKVPTKDTFVKSQLTGLLRSMMLRIETILSDNDLINAIDYDKNENIIDKINNSNKKVHILDLNISSGALDIVLFLLFKSVYLSKIIEKTFKSHLVLVLEEAHRYINNDTTETKLGNYFIDKLSREGRKFGMGLIICSQVPSMLSYSIISQCNSVIMHKITSKKDNDFLRGVLRVSSSIYFDQMNSLAKQYAIVCGEAFANDVVVKINDANPLPHSSDPKIKDIIK